MLWLNHALLSPNNALTCPIDAMLCCLVMPLWRCAPPELCPTPHESWPTPSQPGLLPSRLSPAQFLLRSAMLSVTGNTLLALQSGFKDTQLYPPPSFENIMASAHPL
ncbi:Beta-taxilin [Clarias magur]|uniref:Beta-taxilin n=1 Tax=Clarias magur TaxID=1594786 RepID=A0A8J4WWD4_CLAMG|nr:Beta-taxilin [Clarias magur]